MSDADFGCLFEQVQRGLEEFLFKLLVLGCLSDSEGKLWRRNPAHLIVVEALLPDPCLQRQPHKEVGYYIFTMYATFSTFSIIHSDVQLQF